MIKYRRVILLGLLIVLCGGFFFYIESKEASYQRLKSNSNAISSDKKQKLEEYNLVQGIIEPCTATNPINHGFIDLRGLSSSANEGKALPWTSKGYDSGHNYTIGICSNPFKKHHDEVTEMKDGVSAEKVGAYYRDSKSSKYVSLGEYSSTPVFRGKKLTLTYENGSACDGLIDKTTGQLMRKSTLLTFTCDREMQGRATVSFIGSFNDCNYFFEVRSHEACPTAAKESNLAVIWIFFLILLAALFVYFSGGLLYKHMKSEGPKMQYKS
ncbi:uncharacterized protein PRCAT00003426001 [Priceomyces carsonii]|uniref:uncharacterized protein n=1 Tax=Priceomyces carsonii TaxID=28549 RepID=UPI002ED8FBAA|nr:unnamed protein product [Priceomyces carsonii]